MKTALRWGVVFGAACLAVAVGCGGSKAQGGGDGGADSSSGGSSGGSGSGSGSGSSSGSASSSGGSSGGVGSCGMFMTSMSPVDPNLCKPQLYETTTCAGSPCSWTVAVPCMPDGGLSGDGGSDAGSGLPCLDWCTSAAPSGAPSPGFCQVYPAPDGGTGVLTSCGGCGI